MSLRLSSIGTKGGKRPDQLPVVLAGAALFFQAQSFMVPKDHV